jgi:hypothetical protein
VFWNNCAPAERIAVRITGICVVPAALVFAGIAILRAEIEPKRPLGVAQHLRVSQDAQSVVVAGETFAYAFSRANGLISSVQVLGFELTDGTGIPDLRVAEQLDPTVSPWRAQLETAAEVSVASAAPDRVVIQASGGYVGLDGRHFQLRYSIAYDISIDGVILVSVVNTARGPCSFRWLSLSGGAVRSEMAKFLNWMPEQSASQSTHYQFRSLAGLPHGKVLGGIWIPWIWIGDHRVGLEVTTWDVDSQTYNRVDSSARDDEPEMFNVRNLRWR